MAKLADLEVFVEDEVKWIFIDDFLKYLRSHLKPTDHVKELRRLNFLRFVKQFPEAIAEKQNKPAVHYIHVLRYYLFPL